MLSCRRVGIIGASGQLGTDLVQVFSATEGFQAVPLNHAQLDVADEQQARAVIVNERLDVVVNCAAFHRVDECEERADEALRINAQGSLSVSRACAAASALCVFVSTDYVFSGKEGGYHERSPTEPVNVYGVSKVAGELLVRQTSPEWLILRIASVFGKAGARGKGGNFIEAILQKARAGGPLQVIDDNWMSPTYTRDAAATLRDLIGAGARGVFHAANAGRCSWWEFAREAVRQVGLDVAVVPIPASTYPAKARRPRDSSFAGQRVSEVLGRGPRPWQDALREYLQEKGHLASGSGR